MLLEGSVKLNRDIVSDFFEKIHKVLVEYNFIGKSKYISIIDNKGYMLILDYQKSICSNFGLGNIHLISPEHDDNISIVVYGDALGQVVPCMILSKWKR
jgi:hypothetical protein